MYLFDPHLLDPFALEVSITIAKLTDATLRLWAELLDAVPDSRLVLKASAQNDSDTQRLLASSHVAPRS